MVVTTLAHHIDVAWLREAYRLTRKNAAPGVDGQTAVMYAAKLEDNLEDLLGRFKSGRYHAPPVRRVEIAKDDGRSRPIGIPTFEDKVLQRAVAMALEPIYEEDFLDMSHGFRPGRSPHTALAVAWEQLMRMRGGWVLEVDVENFFETVNHGHLRSFLDQRVRDGVIRRAIDKWLKAGVMEAGAIRRSSTGTPQGGVLSPLLANIYLHEVVDLWFDNEVKPRMRGACFGLRYADDLIFVFATHGDAERVMNAIPKRLARFGLRAHPNKTRLVDFRRPSWSRSSSGSPPNRGKPGTFVLLGFTHYWGRSSKGLRVSIVKRKTSSKSFSRSLKKVTAYCRRFRHRPVPEQHAALQRKVRGHYAYFGITGNGAALDDFLHWVYRIWAKWLGRRNPRVPTTKCSNVVILQELFRLPRPRVVHSVYART
jgi:group II intron reverse transcriptase/maturase